jgi:hypothetical protein
VLCSEARGGGETNDDENEALEGDGNVLSALLLKSMALLEKAEVVELLPRSQAASAAISHTPERLVNFFLLPFESFSPFLPWVWGRERLCVLRK